MTAVIYARYSSDSQREKSIDGQLDTTKNEHKQRLIDSFVNAVYVYDDKLVLTFNYNEANTTVTLDEVNGSIIECSGAPKPDTGFDTMSIEAGVRFLFVKAPVCRGAYTF